MKMRKRILKTLKNKPSVSMKISAITLILLCAITLQAQNVEQGSLWYNGALVYDATLLDNGNVVMSAMTEGGEFGFMLVPMDGEPGAYSITRSPNDAMMVEDEGDRVQHIRLEGLDVLIFYRPNGSLYKLMSKTEEQDNQPLNVKNWMTMIRGDYTLADGTRVTIDWDKALVGGTYVPVETMTYDGQVTGILNIDGDGTPLNGCMEVDFTTDGLILYKVAFDEFDFPHRLFGDGIALTESNPNYGRYDFVSSTLLHGCELYYYDKPQLRLMRNFILARHGYVFQSKDLQDYFGNEPWYRPAYSNDDIKLSFVERTNIELIKYREATMDIEQ